MHAVTKMATNIHMMKASFSHNEALKVALQAPTKFRASVRKESTFPLIWDSGASVSITNCKSDFLDFNPNSSIKRLNSVGNGHNVMGEGHVLWYVTDESGMLRGLKLKAYYIPDSKVRLISTSSLLQQYQWETISVDYEKLVLSRLPNQPTQKSVIVSNHPSSNLPTCLGYDQYATENTTKILNSVVSTVHADNINLQEHEKELLRWHFRLGHLSFKKVQHLMRNGVLSHSKRTRRLHTSACKIHQRPRCAGCQFGKQTCRAKPGRTSSIIKDRSGVLRHNNFSRSGSFSRSFHL